MHILSEVEKGNGGGIGSGWVMPLPLKRLEMRPLSMSAMDSRRVPLMAVRLLAVLVRPLKSKRVIDGAAATKASRKGSEASAARPA
jgi:hypothetical protein